MPSEASEVFSKYADVVREANVALLAEDLTVDERENLSRLVSDPGWYQTPPSIPDDLPIPAIFWIKARPVDAEGTRVNYVEHSVYEKLATDDPALATGRHTISGEPYIVIHHESGPGWIGYAKDATDTAVALVTLVPLLTAQIRHAVNRLRGRARPDLPQYQGGLPDTRFIQLELHTQEGMTVAAKIPVDGPAESMERITAALVAAIDQPRQLRRR